MKRKICKNKHSTDTGNIVQKIQKKNFHYNYFFMEQYALDVIA